MQGKLLVDKPIGWTSFDVVNYVRRMVATEQGAKPKSIKVGHIGTLDPMASGLLVLLIGKHYTVQATSLSKLDKIYEVQATLGATTDSYDSETEVKPYSDHQPSIEDIETSLTKFTGKISQTPPIYSALKVKGKRAYDLARKGKPVELEPRKVTIYSISKVNYKYPLLKFEAHVSSGTYIRSLANDIGQDIGSGAYLSALRRSKIGDFDIKDAIKTDHLDIELIKQRIII